MDLIKNEVVETKEKMAVQQRSSTSSSSGQKPKNSSSSSSAQKQSTVMVGFRDALDELLHKLTRGHDRQIIPIVGMGGMGKTTLARNVYEHPLVTEIFNIHAWATISHEHNAENILNEILSQSNKDKGDSSEANVEQIGNDLYKYLFGRKYLIVMDDMWSIDAWERIKFFFPDNKNGSRIVVTTRLSNLARLLSNSYALDMRFLDFNESWDLFSKIVFPGDDYPFEIVKIGKKIVGSCGGLPLSIVVVGGFLAKSGYKKEHWEYIEENLSSFVNSDNDENCLKILQLSYNQLPVHLKPCFLYMGVFEEDEDLISCLVMLWVAEGFLKPIRGKNLEEVAKDYLNDLVDRNLVESAGCHFEIHDLLRDLCLKQAKAEKFYNVITHYIDYMPNNQRRIVVPKGKFEDEGIHNVLRSMPLTRSLICHGRKISMPHYCRLLRIYQAPYPSKIDGDCYFLEDKLHLFNLRFLYAESITCYSKLNSSLHLLWSLQTLIFETGNRHGFNEPLDIWNWPQLRHVFVEYMTLPDPPVFNGVYDIVLKNLYMLGLVRNFKCSEEVVKRIPNIMELYLDYDDYDDEEESCLSNLDRLHKLKKFIYCSSVWRGRDFMHKLTFPRSLEKIELISSYVHFEDLLEKIGSLPLLRSLKLQGGVFTTHVWETVEGQFPKLKKLKLRGCAGLEYWNSESSHFPRLERLVLHDVEELKEFPSGIGEIPTLQLIELLWCSPSVIISCKRMQEEQEEFCSGLIFQVEVLLSSKEREALQHLSSPNFKFRT